MVVELAKTEAFAYPIYKNGGRSVTLLEPIYIITNWFLNDNNQTSFKLPKITATERKQQILDMNYVF
mgnify:CR=1 FL=1